MNDVALFHNSRGAYFPVDEFRAAARKEVESSLLIRNAALGNLEAAVAMHVGFWAFVLAFEGIIDRHRLPVGFLRRKFPERVTQVFGGLKQAVEQMQKEEESHAAHWRKDAENLGVLYDQLSVGVDRPVPGVGKLIDMGLTRDHPAFFAVLAGTEYIAEELSAVLTRSSAFTDLFRRKRWVWGDVHLIPHDHGPSHLEIDLDLARACSPNDEHADREVPKMVFETIRTFGKAAEDVWESLGRSSLAA